MPLLAFRARGRPLNRDTLVGIVGAAILVAAMAGIFWYEGTRGAGTTGSFRFDVEWATAAENGPQTSGNLAEGESTDETVAIEREGLASVDFVLVWTDSVGTGDTFKVTVTSPTGETKTAEATNDGGAEGEAKVTFTGLNPAPSATSVAGDDEEDAKRRLTEGTGMTGGVGDWMVTIELVQAGDQSAPVPQLPPVTEDPGNDWKLKTVLTVHDPALTRA